MFTYKNIFIHTRVKQLSGHRQKNLPKGLHFIIIIIITFTFETYLNVELKFRPSRPLSF